MTTDRTRPLQGYKEPEQPSKDNTVDPVKFQEELKKVSESDSSQKRHQRNRKKTEEEGETEEDVGAQVQATPNTGSFAAFMGQGSDSDNAFSVKSPENIKTIQTTSSGSHFSLDNQHIDERISSEPNPTEGTEEPPSTPTATPSAPPTSSAAQTQRQAASSPTPSQNTASTSSNFPVDSLTPSFDPSLSDMSTSSDESKASYNSNKDSDNKETSSRRDATAQKPIENQPDQSLYGRKGTRAKKQDKAMPDLKLAAAAPQAPAVNDAPITASKAKASKVKIQTEPLSSKTVPLPPQEEAPLSTQAKQAFVQQMGTTAASQAPTQSKSTSKKIDTASQVNQSDEKKLPIPSNLSSESTSDQKKKNTRDEKKEPVAEEQPPLPAANLFNMTPTIIPPAPSAYSSLPPQLMELFDKMIGLITVQQASGSTTVTTVTLNMPNSVFNGAQIVLSSDKYTPNTFNVQLMGSPQATQLFDSKRAELIASLEQNKQSFKVNLQGSVLLPEYQVSKKKEPISRIKKKNQDKEDEREN